MWIFEISALKSLTETIVYYESEAFFLELVIIQELISVRFTKYNAHLLEFISGMLTHNRNFAF